MLATVQPIVLLWICNTSPFSAAALTSHIRATLASWLLNCCALGVRPSEMEAFDANYRRRR